MVFCTGRDQRIRACQTIQTLSCPINRCCFSMENKKTNKNQTNNKTFNFQHFLHEIHFFCSARAQKPYNFQWYNFWVLFLFFPIRQLVEWHPVVMKLCNVEHDRGLQCCRHRGYSLELNRFMPLHNLSTTNDSCRCEHPHKRRDCLNFSPLFIGGGGCQTCWMKTLNFHSWCFRNTPNVCFWPCTLSLLFTSASQLFSASSDSLSHRQLFCLFYFWVFLGAFCGSWCDVRSYGTVTTLQQSSQVFCPTN